MAAMRAGRKVELSVDPSAVPLVATTAEQMADLRVVSTAAALVVPTVAC